MLPTHSQKWCPLESSVPLPQDSVSSNSVRKTYPVLEGGLFRDPVMAAVILSLPFPVNLAFLPSFSTRAEES